MTTTREELRELIDRLPEDQLDRAARLLAELGRSARTFDEFLASVPEDDEPTTDEGRAAIAQGREDYRAGRTIPLSDIPRRTRGAPPH
jgi:hypothetical protein